MTLAEYRCPRGHVTESVQRVDHLACHHPVDGMDCGLPAKRDYGFRIKNDGRVHTRHRRGSVFADE